MNWFSMYTTSLIRSFYSIRIIFIKNLFKKLFKWKVWSSHPPFRLSNSFHRKPLQFNPCVERSVNMVAPLELPIKTDRWTHILHQGFSTFWYLRTPKSLFYPFANPQIIILLLGLPPNKDCYILCTPMPILILYLVDVRTEFVYFYVSLTNLFSF
jgi:hypothetical protein